MNNESLEDIAGEIINCRRCGLWKNRLKAVPGEGNPNSRVMFIGEAPGRQEDIQGRPFVGRAGELLTELIESIGLRREEVFITNVVKCRPPNNRDPTEEEINTCLPYLKRQIEVIRPEVIVTLGRHAAKTISREAGIRFRGITRERGRAVETELYGRRIVIFYTYHPAAALYNPKLEEVLRKDFEKLRGYINSRKRRRGTLEDFI